MGALADAGELGPLPQRPRAAGPGASSGSGGNRDDGFIVIVNHFKSKVARPAATGDNVDKGDGAGSYNGDRTRQAKALAAFADSLARPTRTSPRCSSPVTSTPTATRTRSWRSTTPATTTLRVRPTARSPTRFGGLAGSLDHAFANDAALAHGHRQHDVWSINANESVYYEYSRFNANVDRTSTPSTPSAPRTTTRRSSASTRRRTRRSRTSTPCRCWRPTTSTAASSTTRPAPRPVPRRWPRPSRACAWTNPRHRLRDGRRHRRRLDVRVVHPERQADHRRHERGRPRGVRRGQPRVRPGLRRPDEPHHDAVRRRSNPTVAPSGPTSRPTCAGRRRRVRPRDDREDGNFAHSNGATWWKNFAGLNGGAASASASSARSPRTSSRSSRRATSTASTITGIVDEVNDAAAVLKADGCGGEPCDLVVELVHEGAPTPELRDHQDRHDSHVRPASCTGPATTSTRSCRATRTSSTTARSLVPGKTFSGGAPYKRPVVSAGQYGSYLNQLAVRLRARHRRPGRHPPARARDEGLR